MDHVPGLCCTDPSRRPPQVAPVRGEVAQAGNPQAGQPPTHGAQVHLVPEIQQVTVDAPGRAGSCLGTGHHRGLPAQCTEDPIREGLGQPGACFWSLARTCPPPAAASVAGVG